MCTNIQVMMSNVCSQNPNGRVAEVQVDKVILYQDIVLLIIQLVSF